MDSVSQAVRLRCSAGSLTAALSFCQEMLLFDNAKEDVLVTLIENLDFCSDAERTILEKLDKLAFPSSRNGILKAISDRKNQG
jgi:hypothetical protein